MSCCPPKKDSKMSCCPPKKDSKKSCCPPKKTVAPKKGNCCAPKKVVKQDAPEITIAVGGKKITIKIEDTN